jgi:hypothetical protein
MANKWLAHVKSTLKKNKGMKFGQVLKLAKKTYTKKGGADAEPAEEMVETPAPAAGRRRKTRRAGRKTRKAGRR